MRFFAVFRQTTNAPLLPRSIRRILVITLEAATLTRGGTWSVEAASIFRASMIEIGLLGVLVLVLVFSITLSRRFAPPPKDAEA
jgi:hypothetical protein